MPRAVAALRPAVGDHAGTRVRCGIGPAG